MLSLQKRRLQGNLTATFQYLEGAYKHEGDPFITQSKRDRTRENGFKRKEGKFLLDVRKKFFTRRVVRHRHRLPKEIVNASSLQVLEARSDGAQGGWRPGQPDLVGGSQPMSLGWELSDL